MGQCAVKNQDHPSNFTAHSHLPVELAPALKHIVRAMDKPRPLKRYPLRTSGFPAWEES